MKLIIDISNKMFDIFKKNGIMTFDSLDEYDKDILADTIANGIPYEERPQGEWEEINERIGTLGEDNIYTSFKCPFCGHVDLLDNNYCGNCGADLRGDNNGKSSN